MTQDPSVHGDCLSCAVAAGAFPAHVVHETVRFVAFLDADPIRPGHLRIVPRDHYPHFNALPPSLASELLHLGQRLAEAQRAVFKAERVGFLFPAGGEPHAQVEVVPLLSAGDVTARRRGATNGGGASEAELAQAARLLQRELAATEAASRGRIELPRGAPCELSTIG
ncbi:MAG: HIT family protein [Kiloniellaceae bacterium]